MTIAAGLIAGVLAAVWSIWITRRQCTVGPLAGHPHAERRSWAVYLLVAALIYVVFAWTGAAPRVWKWIELWGVVGYGALAVAGWRAGPLWLVLGWALHASWDTLVHGLHTPFVAGWYRWACLSFDVLAAVYLAKRVR
jgi:hypothetical protein